MSIAKKTIETKSKEMPVLFTKDNFIWMAIGGITIALGFFLMSGGKNTDTTVFDDSMVYSFTRITVAPTLILLGLGIEIFAIFKKAKTAN